MGTKIHFVPPGQSNFTVPLFERTAAYSCIALTRMTTKQNECNSFCAGLGSVADRFTALLIYYKRKGRFGRIQDGAEDPSARACLPHPERLAAAARTRGRLFDIRLCTL